MERRTATEFRLAGGKTAPRLVGYAAVFDARSEDLGGFVEYVRPGAFTRSLKAADVVALVHHRPELILGRSTAGTLRLSEDKRGLAYEIDLPDTQAARDLAVSVERGDVRGASFAFTVAKGGDRWSQTEGRTVRELLDVNLHDVTITAMPAYSDTSVAQRAMLAMRSRPRLAAALRFMETC